MSIIPNVRLDDDESMAITEINPTEDGRYEVVEVPAVDYVPRWPRVSIPARGLFLASAHPRAGAQVLGGSTTCYVWKGYPDGTFVRSSQSVPDADVFHAATENIILSWQWSAAGFSSIYIDDNNEPTLVSSGSAPHVDYKNENNLMNWTYHEGNLILWGHKAWPNSTVMELWTAPVSAGGAIGTWSYVGPHSIAGSDVPGRGGTPRLAAAPHVNMMTEGSGNGRIYTINLEGTLDGTPLSLQDPAPGTDALVSKYAHQHTFKRGPLMDRIVVHRNNLDAIKPLEEWTWNGAGFSLASRYWQAAGDMTLIPGARADSYGPFWEVTPTLSGGLIASSQFLDTNYDDVGSIIYTDPFSTGIQKFTITSDNGYANHAVNLYPVEVGDGETALAHAYDYADSDAMNPLNERILIIRPKITIGNRMKLMQARFWR